MHKVTKMVFNFDVRAIWGSGRVK